MGVTLDLTWNLKRHTDVFAGVVRYAQEHDDWKCIIDDFAADTLQRKKGRSKPFDGIIGRITPELAGIGTPQQFARVFRRDVRVSPREYRGQFVDNE